MNFSFLIMCKYTFFSMLILLSSNQMHASDNDCLSEEESARTLIVLSLGEKREHNDKDVSEPAKKKRKFDRYPKSGFGSGVDNKSDQEQGKNPLETRSPHTFIKMTPAFDCFKHYADFYKSVRETPDFFRHGSDQYKTLLKYIFEGYICVDLEALGLLPDINEIDFIKGAISDHEKHCLRYLIEHKSHHIQPILPHLKANNTDDNSLYILGVCYHNNIEGRHDEVYEKEVLTYIQTIEVRPNKSPYLFNILSFLYKKNAFLEQNKKKSFEFMQKAAETGLPMMQHNLGNKFLYGEGLQRKYVELAFQCYGKAANQGFVFSQFNLAVMYEKGWGTQKNSAKALEWYKKAASQGSTQAFINR